VLKIDFDSFQESAAERRIPKAPMKLKISEKLEAASAQKRRILVISASRTIRLCPYCRRFQATAAET
jgi:hypothetical protein